MTFFCLVALVFMCAAVPIAVADSAGRETMLKYEPQFDLSREPLRSNWTKADLSHMLSNERLIVFLDAQKKNPDLGAVTTTELHELIFQREFGVADYLDGFAHPRDLPLTTEAYTSLTSEVTKLFLRGEILVSPDLQEKHADIYRYRPQHFVKNYPASQSRKGDG